jgi:Predicted membrane protein (DUF2142)
MSIGSVVSSLRSKPRGRFLVTFALVAALTGLWALGTPLFANADEPAHVVRAASVARGELVGKTPHSKLLKGYTLVKLPAIYDAAGAHLNCFARKANRDASCHRFTGSESKTKEVLTEAGHHPPAYYAVVGGISRLWPRAPGAVYLMRFVTVLVTALFVAFAVGALSRMASPRVALVGLAVALTPMVLSFGSAVNPTAPETAAAIATWACGLVVVSELRAGKEPDRGVVIQLGVAASALVLARQISMFWLTFIALILAALLGRDALRRLWRSTSARIWAAVVAACVAAQLLWIVLADGLDLSVPIGFEPTLSNTDLVRETVGRAGGFYLEMLGNVGWLDTTLPGLTYLLLTVALGALVLLAVAVGTRPYVIAMLVAMAITVVTPIALEAWQYRTYGLYWQGRYTLPIAVGVPLLAVFALQSGTGRRVLLHGWFVPALAGMLVVAHVLAFYQALRRWSVGANGPVFYWLHPDWTSVVPQFLLIAAYSVVFVAFVVWLLGGRSGESADGEGRGTQLAGA